MVRAFVVCLCSWLTLSSLSACGGAGSSGLEPEGHSDLLLNELMASNDTVIVDELGEFDDWLELVNRGEETIELGGWALSGGSRSAAQPFVLAAGTELAAGAYLVIWADDDVDQGALHTDFKLSKEGETLALYRPDGSVADSVTFPAQQTDMSWARQPDGSGEWSQASSPSPAAANP
ncbi:MAG: hypothetical protein CMP23_17115 [Rickettsiales bacterium]|nr:hypothetical protein [Rickettsiales bacterium]